MGNPNDKRQEIVAAKMTTSERDRLRSDASRLGISESELLRRGARAYASRALSRERSASKKSTQEQ